MPTIVRSSHPRCPACDFPVFNRRCATCEKCHAPLPESIAYTPAEIGALQNQERIDEERRAARARARARTERSRRGGGSSTGGDGIDLDFDVDVSDLLGD